MDAIRLPVWLTVCALVIMLVRQQKPEFATIASVAAGVSSFFLMRDELTALVRWIGQIQNMVGNAGEAVNVMLKAGGIALISEFASDLCTDAGEKALAGRIDLAERVVLTAMCIPFASQMLGQMQQILP